MSRQIKVKRKINSYLLVLLTSLVLVAIMGVTYALQSDQRMTAAEYYEQRLVRLSAEDKDGNESVLTVSKTELMMLQNHTFSATRRTSSGESAQLTYTGILLRDFITTNIPDHTEFDQAIVSAVDGYRSVVPYDRIFSQDDVYLVFEENGRPLLDRDQGGGGPVMLVIVGDTFSQNWCKFVVEVSLR